MCLAASGTNERIHTVCKGQQTEQVALLFRGKTEHECGGDETLENRLSRGKPRRVHHNINLLRAFDLKNLCNGFAAPGRGFPMDVIEAVAGHVLTQLFKIAALA